MSKTNKIFKIVKIINEYKVVVNAGANHQIREDDCLEVFAPGEEIIDPDTNLSLGTLDLIKAKLRVVDVLPQMCICEDRDGYSERTISVDFLTYKRKNALNVDAREISGGFENIPRKIHVGDLVREAP